MPVSVECFWVQVKDGSAKGAYTLGYLISHRTRSPGRVKSSVQWRYGSRCQGIRRSYWSVGTEFQWSKDWALESSYNVAPVVSHTVCCCVMLSPSVVSDSLRFHGLCPPGSSVHGISQTRTLEWAAMPFSWGIFLTQGSNPHLLCLLLWQVGSLPLVPPWNNFVIDKV